MDVIVPKSVIKAIVTMMNRICKDVEAYQDSDILLKNTDTKLYSIYYSAKYVKECLEKELAK